MKSGENAVNNLSTKGCAVHTGEPLSLRAVTQRIRRVLAKDSEKLLVSRSNMERSNFGNYYVVDDRNNVIACHCEIEDLAKELGVLTARC